MQTPIVYVGSDTKWEYKIVEGKPDLKRLNELGEEGWELAGVLDSAGIVLVYFKRSA